MIAPVYNKFNRFRHSCRMLPKQCVRFSGYSGRFRCVYIELSMKKYIFIFVAALALAFLRSPIYSFGYQAIHGSHQTFGRYRLKMPRWYSPMNSETDVYFSAGNSFPSHARVIGITGPLEGKTYEKTRQFVQESLRAQSVVNEQTIPTPAGYAKCFEILLTNGRIEAACRWEIEPIQAVYIGPVEFKNELYETVRSAEKSGGK